MIFTIGHTKSYEQYFKEQGTPNKLGRRDDYGGGIVWKSKEEAQKNCPKDYSVYGVIANWEKDTIQSNFGSWHALLKDAKLVKL